MPKLAQILEKSLESQAVRGRYEYRSFFFPDQVIV